MRRFLYNIKKEKGWYNLLRCTIFVVQIKLLFYKSSLMSIPVKSAWTGNIYLWNKVIAESWCSLPNNFIVSVEFYTLSSSSSNNLFVWNWPWVCSSWECWLRLWNSTYYWCSYDEYLWFNWVSWWWNEHLNVLSCNNRFKREVILNMDTWEYEQNTYDMWWTRKHHRSSSDSRLKNNNLIITINTWDRYYQNAKFRNFKFVRWTQVLEDSLIWWDFPDRWTVEPNSWTITRWNDWTAFWTNRSWWNATQMRFEVPYS